MNFGTRFSFFSCYLLLVLGGFSINASAVAPPDGSLIWHTYQGGNRDFDDVVRTGVYHDRARGVAQDSAGNLYVIGHSAGPWDTPEDALNPVNPHTPVVDWNSVLSKDVFVAKFNPDGVLIWHTFIGAEDYYLSVSCGRRGEDNGLGITVDPFDAVLVTGWSNSAWGAPVSSFGDPCNRQAFVAKLDPIDGSLDWNTFLGAGGWGQNDGGNDITTDAAGNIYVIGDSYHAPWGTPVRPWSGQDAWVAKLDSAGNLVWNTFFGTTNHDYGEGIVVDSSGNIYVTGNSALTFTDGTFGPDPAAPSDPYPLPVDAAEGGNDGYLAKLDNAGNLQWYTFLGGAEGHTTIEPGYGVDIDDAGHVFVTGRSYAPWGGSDTVLPYTGAEMAFVAKVNASTGALLANTFMHRYGRDIAVDAAGHVFVTGMALGGGADAFACELDNDLNLQWCTKLFNPWSPELYQWCGGNDIGHGIIAGADGYVYIAGLSQYECTPAFFPLTPVNHHADFGETSTGDDMLLAKIKTGGGDIWGISLNDHNAGNPGPSSLYRIDRATGAGTLVGTNLGYAVNSIAIDPTTGVMYAATTNWSGSFNGLLEVDTSTGTATEIGAFGGSFHTIVGLTFDSTGQLWGWNEFDEWGPSDDLVQIDKTTGAATVIGDSGINTYQQVMAFDASDTLVLVQELWDVWVQEIFTIDTGTGTATGPVTPLGFNPGSGGAAFDPATGLLWACATRGWEQDSIIRITNIGAKSFIDLDTDIEFLHAITISDVPYIADATNTPPVAEDDAYVAAEDTALVVTAPGVLVNDYDVDGDVPKVKQLTVPAHGGIVMFADGSFTYTPDANYCGSDSFTYIVTDDPPITAPALDSPPATVSIDVTCVNDAPVAVGDAYATAEDTQLVVAAPGVLVNDFDVDGDTPKVKQLTMPVHGGIVMMPDGSFTYTPNANYCGPDTFTYIVTDDPPITAPALDSTPATVDITVGCVNDPPMVTSVTPGTGIVDYSDYIGQVTVVIEDIDSDLGPLHPSIRWSPGWDVVPANLPQPYMNSTEVCVVVPNESIVDGTICTYTLDGQIVEPGDRTYTVGFKGRDEFGDGPECTTSDYTDVSVCQHVLTVEPEDATVMLDAGNAVAVEVVEAGGNSGAFSLFFSAWETNDPDFSHGVAADFGDLNQMVPDMALIPVGPGGPVIGICGWDDDLEGGLDFPKPVIGQEYGQVAYFQCDFVGVPVNTYEVLAVVDGVDETHRYYSGADEDVFTVYDPSLGHITGGGWFYWPDTCSTDTPEDDVCNGVYTGDKTNFGFTMKYNKKQKNLQGSLLLMRHTITDETWKVKSNALGDMSVGEEEDGVGAYGWAAVEGKATFREPGFDNTGGNPFLMYVEDHGEQGCDQDPVDEFWIEVTTSDGVQLLQLNGPEPADNNPDNDPPLDGDDEPIECGNIFVPHKTDGKDKPRK